LTAAARAATTWAGRSAVAVAAQVLAKEVAKVMAAAAV